MRLAIVILLAPAALGATGLEDDAVPDDPIARALAVSSGELRFLAAAPERRAHQHSNRIELSASSLRDGWVGLHQCHTDLDPVPDAEIIFRPGRIRNLVLQHHQGIGQVFVQGASVQLRDVAPGATLCLDAETRALERLGEGVYELRNGPYMRRFLDGYYPMRVSLDIHYPAELEAVDHTPESQPGFAPRLRPRRIVVDTWFEGMLETRFRFLQR